MAEEQLGFSPAALAGGLESQTCQLLHNEHQKVTDAAFKLDLLSQELQSMWSAQGSLLETVQPLQTHGRSVSAPDFSGVVSRLERQSEHGGQWAGGEGPVQTPTQAGPQSLPTPYTFDPLPVPQPVKPPRTQRGRLERGYAVPYSPEEQHQSDLAPSPRLMQGYQIPYSPQEQRQSDRAPSPRLMQGYQKPYSPEEQRQSDRYLIPYSPEEVRQSDRAPSPRLMQGYQKPYSPEEQRQPDRYLTLYSPEEQRHPSERAPSPRLLQSLAPDHHHHHLAPSFHPAAEAENPYGVPSTLRDPALPPAGGTHSPPGVYGPATTPTFYIGAGTRGSPQQQLLHYPAISAVTERGKPAFDTVDASPTARPNPDFYTGDGGSQRKPAGVWAEADLDIAYEKKSKAPNQESKGDLRSWSLPRLGRDNWKQTDLDLANPISKAARGRIDADTIQLYGTLPKGSRPPWATQPPPPRPHRPLSPWGSPVLARSHFPPAGQWSSAIKERRNVLPLSVLIRPTIVRGRGRGSGPRGPPPLITGPLAPGPLYRQPQTPQGQQAVVPVLSVDVGETEGPGVEGGDGGESTPRPLSPTRLQPVSVPDTGGIRDREELLRIRAAIPRALKKRSSFDHTAETVPGPAAVKPSLPLLTVLDLPVTSGQQQHQEMPASPSPPQDNSPTHADIHTTRSILKKQGSSRSSKKLQARLYPLVVLLDASLLGELEVVQRVVQEIADPSESNDEGITALHNAVCGGHYDIVEFLVNHGVDVNSADSHGWTPLHCAASCNDLPICTLLVKKGAAIFCTTLNDGATAAEKCDAYLDGYEECARFLFSAEQQAGMMNSAVLYVLWDYNAEHEDELSLREGQAVTVLQRGSRNEPLWWWSSLYGHEGYVAHNLLGLFPRVRPAT